MILGASGLVGGNLLSAACAEGHEALGTCHTHPLPGLVPLYAEDARTLKELFRQFQPEVTFCCFGWTWVDGCEADPARAYRENCLQPETAARFAHEVGSHFIHFSTSYVFDGRDGPYDEKSPPSPISVYGHSKLAGENAVLEATSGQAIIARTMGIYGPESQKKNFVYQVRRALEAGRRFCVPNDQFGNATYAPDLAALALDLAKGGQIGIWNLAGPDPLLRRSDFARRIAEAYGLPVELIEPVETSMLGQRAPRPRQGGLLIDKIRRASPRQIHPWIALP